MPLYWGADFIFSKVDELPQNVMEHAIVSTPPLCLYRHSLWGACQHYTRNLPENGKAGGCVSFEDSASKNQMPTWLGFNVKKPSAVEFSPSPIKQITGGEKLHAMLSGVAPATRKRYLSAWNQWAYFVTMRERPTWLTKTGPNWDEDLIDFITFETHVVKNTSATTRVKISAIMFWRIVCEMDGFTKYRGRYQQVSNGLKRGHKAKRKIPFSLDMIEWMYTNYLQGDMTNTSRAELYTATVLGFSFSSEWASWETYECQISNWVGVMRTTISRPLQFEIAKPNNTTKVIIKHSNLRLGRFAL